MWDGLDRKAICPKERFFIVESEKDLKYYTFMMKLNYITTINVQFFKFAHL